MAAAAVVAAPAAPLSHWPRWRADNSFSRRSFPYKIAGKGASALRSHSSEEQRISGTSMIFVVEDGAVEGESSGRIRYRSRREKGSRSFLRRWRVFVGSRKVRSIVLLNILAVIYASNIPVIKGIQMVTDPALFNMVRFTISSIPFLPFMWIAGGDNRTILNGLELGCWISLGYLTEALGLLTSEAGRASFLTYFMVIVVPLIDGLLGAAIPLLTWQGAIVSLIGVGMLESSGSPPCVGDLLNLLSALFFGIHTLRTEHISKTTKKEKLFALLGYEVFVVALFSTIWCFCSSIFGGSYEIGSLPCQQSQTTLWGWMVTFPWIPALYTGIFSTGLCLLAEIYAMRDVSASETAMIYGLEPIWGASFSWLLFGERWDIAGWIGATLILGGSLTVQIFGSVPERSKKICDDQVLHMNPKKPNDPL